VVSIQEQEFKKKVSSPKPRSTPVEGVDYINIVTDPNKLPKISAKSVLASSRPQPRKKAVNKKPRNINYDLMTPDDYEEYMNGKMPVHKMKKYMKLSEDVLRHQVSEGISDMDGNILDVNRYKRDVRDVHAYVERKPRMSEVLMEILEGPRMLGESRMDRLNEARSELGTEGLVSSLPPHQRPVFARLAMEAQNMSQKEEDDLNRRLQQMKREGRI